VTLPRDYWLMETEFTQEMLEALPWRPKNPSRFTGPTLPVDSISHDDVVALLQLMNAQLKDSLSGGEVFRLPTEAEWEYAARALSQQEWGRFRIGKTGPPAYSWGATWDKTRANVSESGLGKTVPVGRYPANAWGLRDMSGNVWEWCSDWYTVGSYRVLRGGSWYYFARGTRVAGRVNSGPDGRYDYFGFRLARGLPPSSSQ
jgi:formylglycine-generating enzyme